MTSEVTQADERDGLLPGGYTADEKALLDSLGGYQHVFNAIADATSVYAEGVGVNIGVRAFIRSINPHRLTAQSGEGRSGAGEDGWVTIAARDGIEAGYGLNDIFPGDPVKVKASSLISDVQLTMQHARTFIASREKMHPDGIALYDEQVAALAALNARQSGEGERNRTIEDIAAERQRQIETEGWTPEHDDVHADGGELSRAAACYAAHASAFQRVTVDLTAYRTADPARHDYGWPWSSSWWKPSTPRRDLVKAGALIVAEIERLDRAALRATDDAGGA